MKLMWILLYLWLISHHVTGFTGKIAPILLRTIVLETSGNTVNHERRTDEYEVQGVSCSSCIRRITPILKSLDEDVVINGPNPTIIQISSKNTVAEMNTLLQQQLHTSRYSITPVASTASKRIDPPSISQNDSFSEISNKLRMYLPLIMIYIAVTCLSAVHSLLTNTKDVNHFLHRFMGYFYLIFGSFKLRNYIKFLEFNSKYNDVARRFPIYNRAYPFLEIMVAVYFLIFRDSFKLSIAIDQVFSTLVMAMASISSFSIARFLLTRRGKKGDGEVTCACLGTAISLPVSFVTFLEDFLMLVMAVVTFKRA